MISEEMILQTSALAAFAFSLALYAVAHFVARSSAFKSFFISAQAFHNISQWLAFAWAGGLAFQFLEFTTAVVLNRTLISGNVIAARSLLPFFGLYVLSSIVFLFARRHPTNHYANEIERAPSLEHSRGGFRGLTVSDVEILRSVKESKGDLRKTVFCSGWLEDEEVLGSMKKLKALNLVRIRGSRAYITPEGSDVLVYPLSLFSAGVDRATLQEMSSAREALQRGDDLHVLSACSRILERNLKEMMILRKFPKEEADRLFGKTLDRATLGDLIGYVREREKDHFLGGMLTTVNEARKSIHDNRQVRAEEAAYVYLLTEMAVKYLHSPRNN